MKLLDARLDLDARCNYRCIYCDNRPEAHTGQSWFPLENLEKILPMLARSCWSVYLSCGGEALMHPQFKEALAIADKHLKGIDVTLVTNGQLLSEANRKAILDSCITKIQVSVHTLVPELYSRLYGSPAGSMQRVLDNVEALIRERGNSPWPKVTITAIAMKSTMAGLPNVARWATHIGADGLRIQKLIPFENPGMDQEVLPSDKDTESVLKETAQTMRQSGKYMDWPNNYGFQKAWSVIRGLSVIRWNKGAYLVSTFKKFIVSKKKRGCWVAGHTIRVGSDGEFLLCRRKVITLPNILENPGMNIQRVLKTKLRKLSFADTPACVNGCAYYFDTTAGRRFQNE